MKEGYYLDAGIIWPRLLFLVFDLDLAPRDQASTTFYVRNCGDEVLAILVLRCNETGLEGRPFILSETFIRTRRDLPSALPPISSSKKSASTRTLDGEGDLFDGLRSDALQTSLDDNRAANGLFVFWTADKKPLRRAIIA